MVGGLLKELVSNGLSDRLVTSTYVIAEAIRRLIKSKPREFVGPGGEQKTDLALYLLFQWLSDNKVAIICPPEAVFDEAKRLFREHRALGCDLSDVISYVIVRGLEQDRILSQDGHFRSLGLTTLLPSPVA
jgi:predicted nucleic acid-binding protein